MERTIKIIEQGNGLNLNHGDRVYDAANGELLRLTSSPGTIHTDDSRGNYRIATAEQDGDPTDLSDAEFAALPAVLVADAGER